MSYFFGDINIGASIIDGGSTYSANIPIFAVSMVSQSQWKLKALSMKLVLMDDYWYLMM